MAWITVHDEVIGGKLKKLQRELGCSNNEALGIIVRLWLWSVMYADEYGNAPDVSREDVEEAITPGLARGLYPDEVVDALIKVGWIKFDKELIMDGWERWQKAWYKEIRVRTSAAKRQKQYRAKKRGEEPPPEPTEKPATVSNTAPIQQTLTTTPIESPKPEKKGYSKDFIEFWEIYPRKVDKGGAFKKYQARLNNGFSAEDLMNAARAYSEECAKENTPQKYILHAKTFLSDTLRFADYLPKNKDSGTVVDDDGTNPWEQFRR